MCHKTQKPYFFGLQVPQSCSQNGWFWDICYRKIAFLSCGISVPCLRNPDSSGDFHTVGFKSGLNCSDSFRKHKCISISFVFLRVCIFLASGARKELKWEKGNSHKMKEHLLCLKHLETKGPTTHAASVGVVVAAAHGMSLSLFGNITSTGN